MRKTLTSLAFVAVTMAALPAAAQTLNVGVWDMPPGKGNPFTGRSVPSVFVWDAVFDPLIRIGQDGSPVPVLAESFTSVEPTRWRFVLREDVRFSNGAALTADAVMGTMEYLLSEDGRASSVGGEMRNVASVEKVDDRTVDIITKGPDPVLPNKLALVFIVEPGAWADLGPEGFAETPIGTGAFKVSEWGPADVTLTINDQSWREANIDGIKIIELPERAPRLQALLSGQIDVGFGFSPDNITRLEADGFAVDASPAPQVMSLAFANEGRDSSPFQDVRVRQAANLAVNRDLIAEVLLAGIGAGAGQPGTPTAFGYNPDMPSYPYDPEKAKALLAEAGYADGFSTTAHVVTGTFPADSEIYQQAAIDLAAVGIKMELQQIRFPEWLDYFLNNTWPGEVFGSSWNTAPYMDTIRPYTYMTCAKRVPHFCDDNMTAAYDATYVEFDPAKRLELLKALHTKTMDVLPALFLVEQADVTGISPAVSGLDYTNRSVNYDNVTIKR